MRIKWLYIFLIFLIIGCNEQQVADQNFYKSPDKKANLTLKKVDEFTLHGPDTLEIAAPNYRFASNHDQTRFAFFDVIFNRFLIANRNGKIVQTIGAAGNGPKEFRMVYTYNYDERDNLIAYDFIQRLMKIFDPEGDLLHTIKIGDNEFTISGKMLFANNKKIYVGIRENKYNPISDPDLLSAWQSKFFASFTYKGDSLKLFGMSDPFLKYSKSAYDRTVFTADFPENKLYAAHENSYRMQIFNAETHRRLAYFGRQSSNFGLLKEEIPTTLSRKEQSLRRLDESGTELIYTTKDYILFFFINISKEWLETKNLNTLDYYCAVYDKKSHDFLDEIELPYRLGLVAGDRLYLIEDEDPANYTIGIYEID